MAAFAQARYTNPAAATPTEVFKSEDVPKLDYHFEEDFLKLPVGITFGEVCGIDIDRRGQIYVFNRGTDHLIVFDEQGNYVQTLAKGYLEAPHGLRIDRYDNIWIVDSGSHVVLRLDQKGHVNLVLGRKGFADSTDTFFYAPTDVAFGPHDEIFVADGYGNSRIVKYDKNGNFIKTWGKAGKGPSEFKTPHTLVVGPDNLLYVGDRDNLRLQIFDLDGNHQATWTHVGAPWGLDLAADGSFIMTDGYAERVVRFDTHGKILGALGEKGRSAGRFAFAHGVAVGRGSEIYVAEILSWRVQKLVPYK
ncbi:peptidyl-alpha-hydroxyglycine alpha-amidating lyase family protein [candidate division KSB1 bacterium]|nr:peptidyl-alpha-hydroxyglycine alpha-amidating lyase family protein [candidate division KSB1 bacterium]